MLYQPICAVEIVVLQLLLLLLLCPLCSHFPDGLQFLNVDLLAIIISAKAAAIGCVVAHALRWRHDGLLLLLLQLVLRLARAACGALHASQLWTTRAW